MTLRETNLAMAGLTLSMFVAQLSNLVVLTALPRIVSDLHGTQAAYTWIVTASMIAITVCMPIWGRLSDFLDEKRLLQLCVGGYVVASMAAGLADTTTVIILCRVAIGVCAAGIIVLMQSISARITTPRHRARWIGYRSAALSVATVGAPTLGGFLTQHLGWRSCFFVGVPIALASIATVQRTLRLPPPAAGVRHAMDWPGLLLLSGGILTLMLWLSVIAPRDGFAASSSLIAVAIGAGLLALAVRVELRVAAPLIPIHLFRDRDIALCAVAATATGFAFFGSAVYLAIYLQIGHGYGPQTAGLMALPEAAATVVGALAASRIIARTGRYKAPLIVGATLIVAGFCLLSRLSLATPLPFIAIDVALVGAGLGMVAENLLLIAQTRVARDKMGSAGALIAFFRMFGGVVSVASLGTLLASHVATLLGHDGIGGRSLPVLAALPPDQRALVQEAYGSGVTLVYTACAGVALAMLLMVALLRKGTIDADKPSDQPG